MASLNEVKEFLARGALPEALIAALAIEDRHPAVVEACRLLVPRLLKAGQAHDALPLLKKALAQKPNTAWIVDLHIEALQHANDVEALAKALRHRFDLNPENPEVLARYLATLDPVDQQSAVEAARSEHAAHVSFGMDRLPQWLEPDRDTSDEPARLRGMYLDLLERAVSNWIYGDAQNRLGEFLPFDELRREQGKDIPAQAHTMIGLKRLRHLRVVCEDVIKRNVPGDFVEAGVWRGGACILMAGVLKAWGDTSRRVVAADSFSGLPPPDDRFPKDALTAFDFHLRPELAISSREVRSNFERYQLWNPQVVILEGLFRDTLPRYPYGPISVLRMDGDLYSSTMDTLENLYDLVSDGGYVVSDDYGVVIDARRAVLDFRASRGIREGMWRVDGDGVVWKLQ